MTGEAQCRAARRVALSKRRARQGRGCFSNTDTPPLTWWMKQRGRTLRPAS